MLPEARVELKKAVRITPVKASAILALGKHLEFEFDYESALKLYRDSLDQIPSEREELHWRIGRVLENLGLYGAALRAFEEGVEASATPRGILSHAEMLFQAGRASEVIEIVTDFQKKYDRETIRFTPALRASAHSLLGRARLHEGDFTGAISDFKKACVSEGGEVETIAQAWNALGVCHAMEARYLDAANAFSIAILKDQYRIEAWTNLATLYLLAGNPVVAEELFALARERDPSDRTAHACTALPLLSSGDPNGVKPALDALLAEDPTNLYLNYLLGIFSLKKGSPGEAYVSFQNTLRQDFAFVPAYGGAGRSSLSMAARLAQIQSDGDTSLERARVLLGPLVEKIVGEGGLLDSQKLGSYLSRLILQSKTFYDRLGIVLGEGRSNLQIAYGCLEALSGNRASAISRFEEARSLNSGEGNPSDPVIAFGIGYVEYLYGPGGSEERLSRARRSFRSASNAVEWTDGESIRIVAEAARMAKEIEEWGMMSLVEDEDFSRDDSDHLRWRGSQWLEEDGPPRASIILKELECLITGTPSENMIVTRFERDDLPPQEFNRLEVTFRPRHQERPSFEFGVSFYDPGRQGSNRNGLHIGFDLKRKIRQTQMPEKKFLDERIEMSKQWKELALKFPLPREIRMRFQKVEENRRSILQVSIWRPEREAYEAIGKLNLRSSSRSGKSGMKISFWARGWQGDAFSVGVDDIRILEKRKR
jgi:tetratricopeptide (TPR) repeat protein